MMEFMDVNNFLNFSCIVPLFEKVNAQELVTLFEQMEKKTYSKGEIIVHEDLYEESFYIIYSGRVKVFSANSLTDEKVFCLLDRGDFFGEMAILEDKPRSVSVVATEECCFYLMPRTLFLQMLEKYPSISIALLRVVCSRLRSANRQVTNYTYMSALEKIKSYILSLAYQRGEWREDGTIFVDKVPSQYEIGQLIGNRRETVSRLLNEMKREGVIELKHRKLLIRDENVLHI